MTEIPDNEKITQLHSMVRSINTRVKYIEKHLDIEIKMDVKDERT